MGDKKKKKVIWTFDGDFGYLSNFSRHSFSELDGTIWSTNEHYFQAAKTKNPWYRFKIWSAQKPGEAKRLGNECPMIQGWENRKLSVMLSGLKMKFDQNKDIAEKLRSLKGYFLIEGNTWHDNYWGNCTCGKPSCKELGHNNLGLLLVLIRDKIL